MLKFNEEDGPTREDVLRALGFLSNECLRIATEHGFTEATPGEDIALMHSELSEALEDIRAGKALDHVYYEHNVTKQTSKPCGVPSELADVVIRVMHFCGKHGINLGKAILEKMEFNESRPYKHGKIL